VAGILHAFAVSAENQETALAIYHRPRSTARATRSRGNIHLIIKKYDVGDGLQEGFVSNGQSGDRLMERSISKFLARLAASSFCCAAHLSSFHLPSSIFHLPSRTPTRMHCGMFDPIALALVVRLKMLSFSSPKGEQNLTILGDIKQRNV
jgi:hypothetical protein